MAAAWRVAIEPLSIPQFRRVFTSNFSFFMAMGGQGLVRPWIALQLTDSALALGLVSAAVAVPMLIVAPYGGALADRVERRKLILFSQSLALASELVILALLVAGVLEYWHLLVSSAVMGCTFPLSMPARQAIVVHIVGRRSLARAVALNMTGTNITRVAGPALAGLLISVWTIEGVFFFHMVLYGVAVAMMARVDKLPPPASTQEESVLESVLDGVRYVRSNHLLSILLVFGLVPMFLAMPVQTLLPIFSEKVWETGARGLGALSASAGLGAVVGSVFVAMRSARAGRIRAMMASVIALGLLLAAFALSPWFWPAVVLMFLANVAVSFFGTLNNTAIQLLIPDRVRGRISAFLMMSFSLPLLGALPVSAVADIVGAPLSVAVASGLAVVLALIFYASSRLLRELDRHVDRAMGIPGDGERERAHQSG